MRSRLDLAALELLVEVADTGSLSAAAGHLGLAQPNASRQLARLERSLGARLLDRGARGSEPTPAGRVAVEHARRVLDAAEALAEEVSAATGTGRIRLLASQTIAEQLMPAFLASLAADLPDAPVSFEVANSAHVLEALRRGRADLGFVEGSEPPPGFASREIGRDRLVAIVAPDHPWARRGEIDADELAAAPLVEREEGSGTREVLARALAPRGMAPPALVVHSNAAVRAAVAGGAGCALLSDLAVAEAVAAGRVTRLGVTGADLRRSLRAVWVGDPQRRLDGPLAALGSAAAGSRDDPLPARVSPG